MYHILYVAYDIQQNHICELFFNENKYLMKTILSFFLIKIVIKQLIAYK